MSEQDGKTEVEFAGVKFRGGKIFVIITALSTLGGGLYAGFEFWKDYMDMKEKIQEYTAPDLSGFDKRIAVVETQIGENLRTFKEEMKVVKNEVKLLSNVNRDLKTDMLGDIRRIEKIVTESEDMVKDTTRELEKGLREVRKEVDIKIKRALENPLNSMR